MTESIPEFTDSYSDDIIFLTSLRSALLRHPLKSFHPPLLDATLARLYAVMLVGNVENSILQEFARTCDQNLKTYLNHKAKNEVKVQALAAFIKQQLSDSVDVSVLDDYLAIKYLRNGIIHSDRREGEQATYITSRGFPLDSRKLNLDHLRRFAGVDQAITMYLGMSKVLAVLNVKKRSAPMIEPPLDRIEGDDAVFLPYSHKEFDRIHRRNLDSTGISWRRLYPEHPTFPLLELPDTTEGFTSSDVATWGQSAEYSWRQILELGSDAARLLISDSKYRAVLLDRMRSLVADGAFPTAPLPANVYVALWEKVSVGSGPDDADLRALFHGNSSFSARQLLEAYALGNAAYELTTSIGINWIWPVLAQGATTSRVDAAHAFIDLYELSRSWYSAIEHHTIYAPEKLEVYRRSIDATRD